MKKILALTAATILSTTAIAQAPAFPGAEGHGRYVTGGRGGKVVHVTNLNDRGTGSFRAAVSGNTKKIVVFDVAGVIPLESDVTIGQNTTVLGQTAPYPGVTVRYYSVRPSNNTIVRYMRFRRGQEKDVNDGADTFWQKEANNIIIDHCSMSWSIDEIASFYDNNNFTMQWCMLGEALSNSGHGKGAHSYGAIWGGKLASFHHNYIGFVQNRSPRFNGARYGWSGYTSNTEYSKYNWENTVQAELVDFRNCVMYNWGNGNGCYGGPGGGYINIVNNYYKAGPGTSAKTRVTEISVGNSGNSTPTKYQGMTSRYFIKGNYVTAASSPANYDWNGVKFDSGIYTINGEKYSVDPNNYYGSAVAHVNNTAGEPCVKIKLDEPIVTGEITTHTAETAYQKVLNYAGASLFRDDVDARYKTETVNGTANNTGSNGTTTKGIIDFVKDCNGYTEANFPTGKREAGFDSDNDGMPDAWETANGLNPNDASDAITKTLDSKGYYTNLEVYANSLVEDLVKAENADAESAVNEYYPTTKKVSGLDYYSGREVERLDDSTDPTNDPSTTNSAASKTWNFSNWTSETLAANKTVDGLTVAASSSKTVSIADGGATVDGVTYTKQLKLGGGGSTSGRYVTFPVDGNCTISIPFGHFGSGDARTLRLAEGSFSTVVASQPANAGTTTTLTYNYTGGPTTFYAYSAGSGLDLFAVIVKGTATGIENVQRTTTNSQHIYNLSGQKVNKNYKGIVIKNGKKRMM